MGVYAVNKAAARWIIRPPQNAILLGSSLFWDESNLVPLPFITRSWH
jgi:hypothetical protein